MGEHTVVLGIVAGSGDLPAQAADACRQGGRPYFVLALKGYAEPSWVGAHPHVWVRLGAAAEGFAALKKAGVTDVVMIGAVRRPGVLDLCPDWRAARLFARIGLRALGDDGLLRAVIAEFEAEGFRVIGIDDVLRDVVMPRGVLGRHAPDNQARQDIIRGAEVARSLGLLDVGQGVVVQQGIVLAVEAVEGTDAMLSRCLDLRRDGNGGVLVKMRKPAQEQRTDLPTIGPETVRAAFAAGLRGVAIQSGAGLFVHRSEAVSEADRLGLFVVGVDEAGHVPA
ncbi:LpxI family protein [Haematospirillum jordaniae]|uniref:LpxI family protein n=1 Tax=Haematospirillum jordaniae TaxID=1549855 RepID=UPI00143311C1|nr:UDP-2,3-diacylglucosamine diphosphatase LpxI [Haematospirillum jordaniae]NKD84757.1 LpxI family protein [Haematospirillum jordaniae]